MTSGWLMFSMQLPKSPTSELDIPWRITAWHSDWLEMTPQFRSLLERSKSIRIFSPKAWKVLSAFPLEISRQEGRGEAANKVSAAAQRFRAFKWLRMLAAVVREGRAAGFKAVVAAASPGWRGPPPR